MIRIDDSLLEELGLISLPKAERDQMLRQIYETLEMRVGMKLAERMSDQQLDEFERFIDTNDEAGALKWLETNFPDYKQVVADELEKLKVEIKRDAPQIMAAMQQALAAPAPQPQMGAASQYPSAAAPAQNAFQPAPAPQPAPQFQSPAPQQPQPVQSQSPVAQPYTPTPVSPAPQMAQPTPQQTPAYPPVQQDATSYQPVSQQPPVSTPQPTSGQDDGVVPPPPAF